MGFPLGFRSCKMFLLPESDGFEDGIFQQQNSGRRL
jgi:hypothetical protein